MQGPLMLATSFAEMALSHNSCGQVKMFEPYLYRCPERDEEEGRCPIINADDFHTPP